MARDQIPGVAVGVVERGHLVFARGFGYRDVDRHLPVTPDTLFALGSCSKAFTATAIALLADEGRIALDAPVRTYLPDFSLARSGGVGDLDDAGSAHPPQRITAA